MDWPRLPTGEARVVSLCLSVVHTPTPRPPAPSGGVSILRYSYRSMSSDATATGMSSIKMHRRDGRKIHRRSVPRSLTRPYELITSDVLLLRPATTVPATRGARFANTTPLTSFRAHGARPVTPSWGEGADGALPRWDGGYLRHGCGGAPMEADERGRHAAILLGTWRAGKKLGPVALTRAHPLAFEGFPTLVSPTRHLRLRSIDQPTPWTRARGGCFLALTPSITVQETAGVAAEGSPLRPSRACTGKGGHGRAWESEGGRREGGAKMAGPSAARWHFPGPPSAPRLRSLAGRLRLRPQPR